jgi:hypothetical protein
MILIPEIRAPFDNIKSRVVHTGESFATGVAYLLFVLMFLTIIAEALILIMRTLA